MVMQVFLDEVNTSSCVGLFKEIIVNKTFDGEVSYKQTLESHDVYTLLNL